MKNLLKLVLLLGVFFANAQEKSLLVKDQIKLTLLSPGISYETKLGNKTTLESNIGASAGFMYSETTDFQFAVTPYIREQFRYYYNLESRLAKGKNIKNNSGNFVALMASYHFRPYDDPKIENINDGVNIGPVWGFQRTYKKSFHISLIGGASCHIGNNNRKTEILPVLNFSLGWIVK